MNDQPQHTRKPLPVREVTRNAYDAIHADEWPSPAGVMDFGIDSRKHLGALRYEFRTGRVSLEQFDDALGWGPALTRLIKAGNPSDGVVFKTAWDDLMVRVEEWAVVSEELFPLGRLFATPEVLEVATQSEITDAFRRHAVGDWGDGDTSKNDAARKARREIHSSYRFADRREIDVRTWFDPPMTLALLDWQLELSSAANGTDGEWSRLDVPGRSPLLCRSTRDVCRPSSWRPPTAMTPWTLLRSWTEGARRISSCLARPRTRPAAEASPSQPSGSGTPTSTGAGPAGVESVRRGF